MNSLIRCMGTALIAAVATLSIPEAEAGRIGGPTTITGRIPGGTSVFYEVEFAAGEQAIVSAVGSGQSQVFVLIYDGEGNVATSNAHMNGRPPATAVMNVRRGGVFRVEVRNMGVFDTPFRLATN
jgi:hypothetical protein